MKVINPNILTDLEQDLVLACKNWYGENGIAKVISEINGCEIESYERLDTKYFWIKELYLKLIQNGNLKIERLFERFFPDYDFPFLKSEKEKLFIERFLDQLITEIQGVQVMDDQGVILSLHDAHGSKFREPNADEEEYV